MRAVHPGRAPLRKGRGNRRSVGFAVSFAVAFPCESSALLTAPVFRTIGAHRPGRTIDTSKGGGDDQFVATMAPDSGFGRARFRGELDHSHDDAVAQGRLPEGSRRRQADQCAAPALASAGRLHGSGLLEMRTPEFADKRNKGPVMVMTVMPSGPISM